MILFKEMTVFIFLLLTIAASGTLAANKSTRIIGGNFAELGQFPYQAALIGPNGGCYCGGSILNEKFILTAGHCAHKPVSQIRVMVGSITIRPPGPRYRVKAKYIHDNYVSCKMDIAILELENSLNFSDTVAPIEIYDGELIVNEKVIISGWGSTGKGGSNKLKYTEVRIGDKKKECKNKPNHIFSLDYGLCLAHDVGTGICMGDSGGPAAYNGKLIGEGICVFGTKCGTRPDGYQRVAYFRDWINGIAFKKD